MAKHEPKSPVMTRWPEELYLVGCGNMAGAMLARWLECGLPPERVTVIRPSARPVAPGVMVKAAIEAPIAPGAFVMLGHKPQHLKTVATSLGDYLPAGAVMLSILAGTPLTKLEAAFPRAGSFIRCMPNMPVRSGRGVVVMHAAHSVNASVRVQLADLCAPLGLVEWLASEALFDAATALSGCGPAFLYRFIDALGAAGAGLGLPADMAARMAVATVEGAAFSAAGADVSPGDLADAVASAGGMTREGLDVLDAVGGLRDLLDRTLIAARDRGESLAALAAGQSAISGSAPQQ